MKASHMKDFERIERKARIGMALSAWMAISALVLACVLPAALHSHPTAPIVVASR